MAPIHILNNVIEDAIQKEKELWIAFQDMRKAFDSVSMHALELSMRRIKFPENLITFIKQLYQDREIRVITDEGPTDFFVAGDGIDQGEVISPLMWKIFYDPLLVRIQQLRIGYQMELQWPIDIEKRTHKTKKAMISALAYADDTTWVAESRHTLQEIIQVSNSFFSLNDIEINGAKSEAIAWRPYKQGKEDEYIQIRTPPS